jgi:adenylate cyclase
VLLHYFVGQKELAYRLLRVEQERSEDLLLNILPPEIAARLKGGEQTIADHYPSVSILFADLVGFTPLTNVLSPNEMVELLNEIYSHFDSLIEKYGVEKIRTIGDNYMIASGLPRPRPDHAQSLANLALEMNTYIASLDPVAGHHLSFRMGINSGSVIAGVIGRKKFAYDVWGDAVNIASRMESQGVPGKIQITRNTYGLLKDDFVCELVGSIDVKGIGQMETWFLASAKEDLG